MYTTPLAHTGAGSANSNNVTTSPIDTTGANLLVVSINRYSAVGEITPTDSAGNTWTALISRNTNTTRTQIWYCFNPITSSTHTFTATSTGGYPSICVQAWAGSITSPFDQQNGATTDSSSTLSTGSVTPTEDNELIIVADGHNGGTLSSIDNGMTISDQVAVGGGTHVGGDMAYKVQTTAAAINPLVTLSTSSDIAAAIATFKAAIVAGGIAIPIIDHHSRIRIH